MKYAKVIFYYNIYLMSVFILKFERVALLGEDLSSMKTKILDVCINIVQIHFMKRYSLSLNPN